MSATTPNTKAELDALFNWNPPPLSLAPKEEGGSRSKYSRPASFYDMHFADRLILKHIVHVKHLHKKIACVVDNKLKSIEENGITLPPPTKGFHTEEERLEDLDLQNTQMKNETSVQLFYQCITVRFCVYVASTLALHPNIWSSVLDWSIVPCRSGYAICDGSLQIKSPSAPKRGPNGELRPFVWDFIKPDKQQKLAEIKTRYKDLATWEVKSLSVGDQDVMLGVITMAVNDGAFRWTLCSGDPCSSTEHVVHNDVRGLDAPETLSLVTTPWYDPDLSEDEQSQTSQLERTQEEIWDDSLKRGGSSLEIVHELQQQLLGESLDSFGDKSPSGFSNVKGSRAPHSLTAGGSKAITSDSAPDLWKARSPPTVESTILSGRTTRTSLLSAPTFQRVAMGRGELTAQKLIQQVNSFQDSGLFDMLTINLTQAWAQGVRNNSTLIIFHSGNFEFVAIRHRESRTLYISDLLHVPRLSHPGYGKVQIGIYLEALEDAFLRNELDKAKPDADGTPHGDADDPGDKDKGPPGSGDTDGGPSNAKRKEFDDNPGPQSKKPRGSKRGGNSGGGKKSAGDRRKNVSSKQKPTDGEDGGPGPDTEVRVVTHSFGICAHLYHDGFKWTIQQALSRPVLLLHIKYNIYDSIRPAIFYRGARVNSNNDGIVTPPTTPATAFPKDVRLLLFLTSELGEGATGVVHGGILQVESEHKISTLEIAAKLAFTDEQQAALVAESFIYTHMAEEGIKCIPTVLGYFHDADEDGPSCLLMSHSGKSLQDRGTTISTDEWYAFPFTLVPK